MSATLQPVLQALGYGELHQQRAFVRLLQAAGALGQLPEVNGLMTDSQADAVLQTPAFANATDAAQWLHTVTQAKMIRPHGMERCDCKEPLPYVRNRSALMTALRDTGLLAEKDPARRHYDHVLLLGAMETSVDERLDMIKQLWDEGVRFDKIHLLGSHRTLNRNYEQSVDTLRADGSHPQTEMEMMEERYLAKSKDWPEELKKVKLFEVDTYNNPDGSRANTQDTVKAWDQTHPKTGSVLAISNQPYARYQDAAVKSVLSDAFEVDTIGAHAAHDIKVSVAMDSIARQIDVGLPKLMEKLQAAQPQMAQSGDQPELIKIRPEKMKVDPATYQFRAKGDKKTGVTQKGAYHATKWEPLIHGAQPLIGHRRLNGDIFVADGHHRHALATELNAKGTGPGEVAVLVYDEAKGYTPADVKIMAAYANIAHGTSDVIDTARVFKEARADYIHKEFLPSLQMDKGNLRMSYSLSKLSDHALDAVARGDVPAQMAAFVAEQVPDDPQRQENVLAIVRQKLDQKYKTEKPIAPSSLVVNAPSFAEQGLGHFASISKPGPAAGFSLGA